MAPIDGEATLRIPDGKPTIIDMFVASSGVAAAIAEEKVDSARTATPHWPVLVTARLGTVWLPTLRTSKAGNTLRIPGPAPDHGSTQLDGAAAAIDHVQAEARRTGHFTQGGPTTLDRAFGQVCKQLHIEIKQLSAQPGGEYQAPALVWRRAEKLNKPTGEPVVTGSDWLYMRLRRASDLAKEIVQRRATPAEVSEAMRIISVFLHHRSGPTLRGRQLRRWS